VKLPEPDKRKTWQLIHSLDAKGIRVLKKEMRDKGKVLSQTQTPTLSSKTMDYLYFFPFFFLSAR
jgi:hypothetical protein